MQAAIIVSVVNFQSKIVTFWITGDTTVNNFDDFGDPAGFINSGDCMHSGVNYNSSLSSLIIITIRLPVLSYLGPFQPLL